MKKRNRTMSPHRRKELKRNIINKWIKDPKTTYADIDRKTKVEVNHIAGQGLKYKLKLVAAVLRSIDVTAV